MQIMLNHITLYDFANESFNFLSIAIPAVVAVAGLVLFMVVRRIIRKPERGGPWLRRMTMLLYFGIAMTLTSTTVLSVSLIGELIEYTGTNAAYEEELSTVEGRVEELSRIDEAIETDAGGNIDADHAVERKRGFAVNGIEFVFAETGVRYGYLGDEHGEPPRLGTIVRVGYYDRKGVNVILKLEVER